MSKLESIIHIGLHKTGSTTLQNVLYRSRRELAEQGFFYPGDYLRPNFQHSILAVYLRESKINLFKQSIEPILRDFSYMNDAQLILSGEEFSTLPRSKVEILRESIDRTRRDFQVVVYIRNLYHLAISQMAQHSKGRKLIAYPASVIERLQDFDPASMLLDWEAVFGERRVQVFCLEALPEGIVAQFADIAGFRVPLAHAVTDLNRSMDPLASVLLSHLAYEFGVPHRSFYRAYFKATLDRRWVLPRTEGHLLDLVADWVGQRNLMHHKLAPYREMLLRRPSTEKDSTGSDVEYLRVMSTVLARTAKEMSRAEKERK